jgi:tryptophanyl-tRNA synthetase
MKRILTGDRPTGRLHLGHYVGTLANRVKLQHEYEMFLIIADLHMLTTRVEKDKLSELKANIRDLVLDYLSVGIDPQKVVIYQQSRIPEVTELFTIFSMLISVPRLQRVPTLKDVMRDLQIETASLGLLSYPVLQAADILMVGANLVPVGRDQASHLEVTREIAEKFNSLYGNTLSIPETLIGEVPTLPGIDGKAKMSKSLDNAIYLSDSAEEVMQKVMRMYTDPNRIHPTDPGTVEGNPVFIYHDAFNSNKDEVGDLKKRYGAGKVSDVEVKEKLIGAINNFLDPIRDKRSQFVQDKKLIESIIEDGTKKAQREAASTLQKVKEAMGLVFP